MIVINFFFLRTLKSIDTHIVIIVIVYTRKLRFTRRSLQLKTITLRARVLRFEKRLVGV